MLSPLKEQVANFMRWHVTHPLASLQQEVVYQQLFDVQCRNRGIKNEFYAVGAAASFGLLYFLMRVLSELEVGRIVEFGSGVSTLLIDRAKKPGTHHVCYEHDRLWHDLLADRLSDCDYRLRRLENMLIEGRNATWYAEVESQGFDLMLVDGPGGVNRFSRFGCVELIKSRLAEDFLFVFDDGDRNGERETLAWVVDYLRGAGRSFRTNRIEGRTTQAVIAGGRFIAATYFY
jgi:predicted O-methyltransferase YrrM